MGKQLVARFLERSRVGAGIRRARAWSGILALAYHRIGDGTGSPFDRGLWSATAPAFEGQLRFLKKHFDVIGPEDLVTVRKRGRGRYVLVTFDDGYRDNYETAFPILKRHGVAGVFFVSTGFLDRPRVAWWDEIAWMVRTSPRGGVAAGAWLAAAVPFDEPDREQAVRALLRRYKDLPGEATPAYLDYLAEATGSGRYPAEGVAGTWMTWAMVRQMSAAGMAIGGHTVTHPVLAQLPPERQEEEIAGCRERIAQELGLPLRWFSYPVGGPQAFNDATRAGLQAQGVEVAFSYYGGFRRFCDWDPYDVRRVPIEADVGPELFRALLTLPQVFARPRVAARTHGAG